MAIDCLAGRARWIEGGDDFLGDAIEGTMDRWNEGSDRSIDRSIDPADTTLSNQQVTQSNLYRTDKLPSDF